MISGIAGNNAELLKASKNSARVNIARRESLRAVDAAARSGAGSSSSVLIGVEFCSSTVRVSIVFVAVITTPFGFFSESSLSFFSDNLGLGTAVGASSIVFAVETMLDILGISSGVAVWVRGVAIKKTQEVEGDSKKNSAQKCKCKLVKYPVMR